MTAKYAQPVAGVQEWTGLGVMCLATLFIAADAFVLMLALPHVAVGVAADGIEQLWIADIYGIVLGSLLITMGGLGDRIGRRRLFLVGAAGFGAASLIAAYATDPGTLIAARALLGMASAAVIPSTLGLIRTMFRDPKQMGVAFGIWASFYTIGAVLGLLVGGVLLANFWWGSVFLANVPAVVVVLALGSLVLPKNRDVDAGRPDWISSLLSLAAILPAVWGVKEASRDGWEPLPIAAIVVGVLLGVAFVRRQRALSRPLLDLSLFRNRSFSIPLLAMFIQAVLTGTVLLLLMLDFQLVQGLTPLQAGLSLAPGLVLSSLCAPVVGVLARRFRPAYLIACGEALVIAGLVLVIVAGTTSGPALFIAGFALWSAGGSPLLAVGMTLMVGSAPPERAGAASSMPQVSAELGNGIGVAVVGSVAVALYHAQMTDSLPPEVPAETAATASQSIANAAQASADLPPDLAQVVFSQAREAFTSSLQVVTGFTAVVLAGVIALIVSRLRHVRPLGQEEPAGQEESSPAADVTEELR
ncbi:MFS transporter [Amycolatopsis cihanbeyliensis]|uniref:DHA2 family multidrug resistance protein-like MFS transporter n=1 Tax=Amycolatopsis cihanbeyliensis TaxID=1128664 RepID=A0A542DQ81_AMYCI|nr:MFS transporter [Amycolatopsis cihanbeyliensis]TQJ05252.1 DHA2 family multidrug resistance protein-like MFS transporter [Amycolatopsis cihanbeyliensis]